MKNYEHYDEEDFIYDKSFIDWIRLKNPKSDVFWSKWLIDHPEKKDVVRKAALILNSITVDQLQAPLSPLELKSMTDYIGQETESRYSAKSLTLQSKFYNRRWFRIAAVLLLVTAFAVLFFKTDFNIPGYSFQQRVLQNNQYEAVNNSSSAKIIKLNDGSVVVLKPGSVLRFPGKFNPSNRIVSLSGEAFFEVKHDKDRPFAVHSGGMVTKVFGTSFTVRAFQGDKLFKVTVTTGKVGVYNVDQQQPEEAVLLLPNEEVAFNRKDVSFEKNRLSKPLPLSELVVKEEFTFVNAPLSKIIAKLESAYGVVIEYPESEIGDIPLTASLSNQPLDQKLELICKAINAHCSFANGAIFISPAISKP